MLISNGPTYEVQNRVYKCWAAGIDEFTLTVVFTFSKF